ncbi:hypothetical protein [uncultured Flavobacterium sp.]|uniref:hypothetical protein n=1 Tax=uncultured Flavobacterium sp. TaxID=165435 RepID=UPI0025D0B95B|nr:hypothetical protein [uncultured Flavobacterium sp.]
MKKLHLIIVILLISILTNAQNRPIDNGEFIVKVKPINSIKNSKFCDTADGKKDAVVVEFDVVNGVDKEKFGDKIYAIVICIDIPSKGLFNSEEIWDLKISETKYYRWDINIFNENLLDKNKGMKKFWIRDISREVILYCGPKNE